MRNAHRMPSRDIEPMILFLFKFIQVLTRPVAQVFQIYDNVIIWIRNFMISVSNIVHSIRTQLNNNKKKLMSDDVHVHDLTLSRKFLSFSHYHFFPFLLLMAILYEGWDIHRFFSALDMDLEIVVAAQNLHFGFSKNLELFLCIFKMYVFCV